MAAADKKESMSVSLFMETNNLEVAENFSTMATLFWGGMCVDGKMDERAAEAWRKQIFEAHAWMQGRGLAGAVMCARDLGNK